MNFAPRSLFTFCLSILLGAAAFGIYLSVPRSVTATLVAPIEVTTITTGLRNPRGLNFGLDGFLYVAEAGGAGTPSPQCGSMGDGITKCYGTTGTVTRIDPISGQAERVLKGLPSLTPPNGTGNGASGVHDISFDEMGRAYITIGFGGNPKWRSGYFGSEGDAFARLGLFNPGARFTLLDDLGSHELRDPDGNGPDTNPYGLLALSGKVVYADAGGNTLNQVTKDGVSTLAVFPNRLITLPSPPAPPGTMVSVQAVPTSVALGPDGDFYVGQLTGGPFQVGAANVYRVPAAGGTPVIAYTRFTNIIDIAFGPDGSLYVREIARNAIPNFGAGGRIVRIAPNGDRTTILEGPPLIAPGGIVITSDGIIYVTINSTSATAGAVLRITP